MKIKKLIVLDLDGTLLDDTLEITPLTKDYLTKLNHDGYMVVLASGRPWRAIERHYKDIDCYGPVIVYNGSYTFHPKDPSFAVLSYQFPRQIVNEIAKKSESMISSTMCETFDTVYVNQKDSYLSNYFPYKGMNLVEGPIIDKLDKDPFTCIMRRENCSKKQLEDVCKGYGKIKVRHWTESIYSELFIEGADKGNALNYLINLFKLNKDDVIAFGDADNDYSMLSVAGHGFAMLGCKSDVIAKNFNAAKKDNNHDGIALTLQEFLKN